MQINISVTSGGILMATSEIKLCDHTLKSTNIVIMLLFQFYTVFVFATHFTSDRWSSTDSPLINNKKKIINKTNKPANMFFLHFLHYVLVV